MRVAWWLFSAILFVIPAPARATEFPRPASLEPAIRFWVSIFAEYSRDQVVVHHAVELDKVYRVLDFRRDRARGLTDAAIDTIRKTETRRAVGEVKAILTRLGRLGPTHASLTPAERRMAVKFAKNASKSTFRRAAEEVHTQRGIRERFRDGIRRSKRYLPEMERVFRAEGMPVELTRLPFIESSFDVRAYSKVGAAGAWQFVPSTGRRFMTVNSLVDERLDPIVSTRGAARYLRDNYDMLGTWPLAITGYNHGPYGMKKAAKQLGTRDIDVIIRRYKGRTFGFASRNFYPEFLAALDVERDAARYFGVVTIPPAVPSTVVPLRQSVSLGVAARLARTGPATLRDLNPALLAPVTSGRRDVPRGYGLRIPTSGIEGFEKRVATHAAERRATRVASAPPSHGGGNFTYRVKTGDNLTVIAKRYGVGVRELQRANGMGRSSLLRTGRLIKIPGMRSHRVQRGQTLSHIARRYGVTVANLKRINGMGNSSFLRAGQVIRIPGNS